MKNIDSSRKDLAYEFRDTPLGPHSAELREILQILRWTPLEGKRILVCTRPNEEWRIGINPGVRGKKIIFEGDPFDNFRGALWGLFRRRWELATGERLEP